MRVTALVLFMVISPLSTALAENPPVVEGAKLIDGMTTSSVTDSPAELDDYFDNGARAPRRVIDARPSVRTTGAPLSSHNVPLNGNRGPIGYQSIHQ